MGEEWNRHTFLGVFLPHKKKYDFPKLMVFPNTKSTAIPLHSHCIKIVHVDIVIKSWCGAQGQGPAIDLAFYESVIKIDAYGSRASQAQYKLRHHVNMQFNKIPTTSYAMQQEMGA